MHQKLSAKPLPISNFKHTSSSSYLHQLLQPLPKPAPRRSLALRGHHSGRIQISLAASASSFSFSSCQVHHSLLTALSLTHWRPATLCLFLPPRLKLLARQQNKSARTADETRTEEEERVNVREEARRKKRRRGEAEGWWLVVVAGRRSSRFPAAAETRRRRAEPSKPLPTAKAAAGSSFRALALFTRNSHSSRCRYSVASLGIHQLPSKIFSQCSSRRILTFQAIDSKNIQC